jgi:hypothetical protein
MQSPQISKHKCMSSNWLHHCMSSVLSHDKHTQITHLGHRCAPKHFAFREQVSCHTDMQARSLRHYIQTLLTLPLPAAAAVRPHTPIYLALSLAAGDIPMLALPPKLLPPSSGHCLLQLLPAHHLCHLLVQQQVFMGPQRVLSTPQQQAQPCLPAAPSWHLLGASKRSVACSIAAVPFLLRLLL